MRLFGISTGLGTQPPNRPSITSRVACPRIHPSAATTELLDYMPCSPSPATALERAKDVPPAQSPDPTHHSDSLPA